MPSSIVCGSNTPGDDQSTSFWMFSSSIIICWTKWLLMSIPNWQNRRTQKIEATKTINFITFLNSTSASCNLYITLSELHLISCIDPNYLPFAIRLPCRTQRICHVYLDESLLQYVPVCYRMLAECIPITTVNSPSLKSGEPTSDEFTWAALENSPGCAVLAQS